MPSKLVRGYFMLRSALFRVVSITGVALLGCAVASGVAAADPKATLAAFTEGLEGLSGQFQQRVLDSAGTVTEDSQGQIALHVPRQFRWEYESPFPQLIVADGNKIWIYDPDLEQVQVRPQGAEEQHSPLTALLDPAELNRQFVVSDGGEVDGLTWVGLEPRGEDAPFSRARLGFSGDELQRMEMTDALDQRTLISFSGWQRNPPFDSGLFRFVPPPDVDVIGDTEDAAQAYPLED